MGQTAIILAAGKSTRMKSVRPKPLHEVCGRPMLDYILQACYGAGCDRILLVVGHGKEDVKATFGGDGRISFVEQVEQLGTGHAARMCVPHLEKHPNDDVFILAGDGPLIRTEILQTLIETHRRTGASASMATAVLADPTGYGRVLRDTTGEFIRIIEQVDATADQKAIREVFPSYYCFKGSALLWSLGQLKNDNAKKEFYLTDTYGHLRSRGDRVEAIPAVGEDDVLGVNTREQLAYVDGIMQRRIQRALMESGVSIISPATTYIESGVSVGVETAIYPNTFIGRDSAIGEDCVIGPGSVLGRGSVVKSGSVVGDLDGVSVARGSTMSFGGIK
jgi:bifunctional UDP-N-acetylglucosamine pyrophosphorylase / glucosamine-1-phosphate N-acetyltransferase